MIEPIWFTFSSRQLHALEVIAVLIRFGLVTVRSSPTSCMLTWDMKLDQADQSSWSKASSMDTTVTSKQKKTGKIELGMVTKQVQEMTSLNLVHCQTEFTLIYLIFLGFSLSSPFFFFSRKEKSLIFWYVWCSSNGSHQARRQHKFVHLERNSVNLATF